MPCSSIHKLKLKLTRSKSLQLSTKKRIDLRAKLFGITSQFSSNLQKSFCSFILLFFSMFSYAQLPDFNLNVTAVNETCSGNGALQMEVSNTASGADITYTLYILPDTSTPVAQTSTNSFNNLFAGNYKVVATQSLNGDENTQEQEATINNLTTELDFEISHTTATSCNQTATLIVNVTSGDAALYEITSGPITVAPQTSNEFSNLTPGTYVVRVYDECENALSKTYTLILGENDITIEQSVLPVVYSSCSEIEITNSINAPPENPIIYPLTITYTIYPPDGSPEIVIVEEMTSGPELQFNISQSIMTFGEETFTVNITITDACNNVFERDNEIDPNPKVMLFPTEAYCGKFLNLIVNNFLPPYQVEFIEAPEDFIPSVFNEEYPGPYNNNVVVFETEGNPVPYGTYTINLIDACGRLGTHTLLLEEIPLEPNLVVNNTGCSVDSGFINVSIPDREIVSATVTVAPDSYENDLPDDLSEYIDDGVLSLSNLGNGIYTILIVDDCGSEYIIETVVPEFVMQELSIITKPNCLTETGSLRLASGHGSLTSVLISSAPSNYTPSLPDDVSESIADSGFFFMNNLPAGDYTFELVDECGFQYTENVYISSYISTPSAYTLNRNCGSFDVGINDSDDSVVSKTYWFQRYFPETETWGHPNTGIPYTEGDIPNNTTAIQILNEQTIYNIFLTGEFRLIKVFQPFNNQNPNDFCLDIFANFSVFSNLVISGVYNLGCDGGSGPSDVIVDVVGVGPFNFSIISPFEFDNGESNTFLNLNAGTYEIKVEDACGNIENTVINIENLLPVVNIAQPDNLLFCTDTNSNSETFSLNDQNALILGNQNPNNFTVSYHLNQADANSGDNALPNNYTNTNNPQTIYARVIHNTLDVCYATTSFQIQVGDIPVIDDDETISICDGSTTTLTATSGYDAYEWSTGETSQSIVVSQGGNYSVTVKNMFGNNSCEAIQNFTVYTSSIATIENIETIDWTANSNSISVSVSGTGDYVFSLDGIIYQESNVFNNLPAGSYTVFVKDLNDCGIVTEDVSILNYPSFFTPNNDGYNDYWQIIESQTEPSLEVTIFDRFGKILTSFYGNHFGWDGTYNGNNMPTNDYWFLVKRADGTTHRGHFTLKR